MILMQLYIRGDRPSRFEDPWTAGVSISVIDCAALENLASVTKQTLSSDPILLNLLLNSNIYNYDRRAKSSSSYIGYYDMRQLMQYLSSDIDNWTSAANNAIIYWKATPKIIRLISECSLYRRGGLVVCLIIFLFP